MASNTAPSPYDRVAQEGVYHTEDATIGAKVDGFLKHGFRFKTIEGLNFCGSNVLSNKLIRDILESTFEWCALGSYKAFGGEQTVTFSFLTNTGPEVQSVFVFLCSSGTQLAFRKGAHLKHLNTMAASNGLLQIPEENLKAHGLEETQVDMKGGGLAILDGRMGFRIIRGISITFGFASRQEVEFWAKMPLPKQEELIKIVEAMGTGKIGTNFEFVDLTRDGQQ